VAERECQQRRVFTDNRCLAARDGGNWYHLRLVHVWNVGQVNVQNVDLGTGAGSSARHLRTLSERADGLRLAVSDELRAVNDFSVSLPWRALV
jgi:hypothetical protein